MREFVYQANNRRGKPVKGTCRAKTFEQADADLRALGYEVLEIKEIIPDEELPAPPRPRPKTHPATPLLWVSLIGGCLWAGYDLLLRPPSTTARAAPAPRPTVQVDLACNVTLPASARFELAFPEIPYVARDPVISGGRLKARFPLPGSRQPTYCILRCQQPPLEQRFPL